MRVQHLNVGARAGSLLAETDAHRWALLGRVAGGFGAGLLAFCILAKRIGRRVEVPDRELRIARTIARDPALARHLQDFQMATSATDGGA